ncbi:tRNA (adenosine(37)-N6)-dimethylallyltransferase MiaA [Defluviitalea phaphyphila]|uniref:tRNA (adenosine(37)-N6)-dimethylallyltransferase MiaA n=1 Tax=Defluviitalea phaphyphila TaxID=1473580 RepID=UPI00072FCDDC|nr:tRNA (adenosine(37)-N6)-dimethylallyltransferase MiaA [Defluviitalea phaphyphila]
MKKPLIVIAGPTASGKTKVSIELAKRINGEIISGDSMQVYKYMNIGTAKPTREEMEGIPHYLIDEIDPKEEFSVAIFKQKAKDYIKKIYDKNKIPILIGGTGFYIQSVVYDIDFTETNIDIEYRNSLQQLAKKNGNQYLHNMLFKVDPVSAKAIHPNNVKRVIRALEYYKQTNKPISEHNKEQKNKNSPYNTLFFCLTMNRKTLYKRINKRVDSMIEAGLVEEVENLLDRGYSPKLISMQGLGYKEIVWYLEGKISLEEAIYIIKRDTRHFAKRQLTWFRRQETPYWINVEDMEFDVEKIVINMMKCIEDFGIII